MLWFTLWFMVILKIPILYLAWVLWWAVKDPPETQAGPGEVKQDEGGGPGWRPSERRPMRGRRGGPHGAPLRRPVRTRAARA
jgi:hypothetical protein